MEKITYNYRNNSKYDYNGLSIIKKNIRAFDLFNLTNDIILVDIKWKNDMILIHCTHINCVNNMEVISNWKYLINSNNWLITIDDK